LPKVGIVTIIDCDNYGNRLQNYAVQEVVASLGFEAETIVNFPVNRKKREGNVLFRFLKKPVDALKRYVVFSLADCFNGAFQKKLRFMRLDAFRRFTDENIKETSFAVYRDRIPAGLGDMYDCFITGSDQVWNPVFRRGFFADFLTFAPDAKRVAYAASFGVSKISEEYAQLYADSLKQIRHISVREDAGADIVRALTGRDCAVLIDPTLMLSAEKWLSIAKCSKAKPKGRYALLYFLGEAVKECESTVLRLAVKRGLDVVRMSDRRRDAARYTAGPDEFLDYMASAEVVFTDSFHGAVFSILFGRPFVIFDRKGKGLSMNARVDSLLSAFALESRRFDGTIDEEMVFCADYSHVPAILEEKRRVAFDFLKNALNAGVVFDALGKCRLADDCVGCGACSAACPKRCVLMECDDEGFLYPRADMSVCVRCGACLKACPVASSRNFDQYDRSPVSVLACKSVNEELRMASSSGGIFGLLAEAVAGLGGVVFGARFDESLCVNHGFAAAVEGLRAFYGSKYVQSRTDVAYAEVRSFLDQGRPVLFSGTPCQTAGLKSFLGREYDGLFCVDFICHGVPSPKAWRRYLDFQESKAGSSAVNASFRDKRYGWKTYAASIIFKDGSEYCETNDKDPYMMAFLSDLCLRPSCHACMFKMPRGKADITLADFWGVQDVMPEMDDDRGTSLVFVNSVKGKALFDMIKDRVLSKEADAAKVIARNPSAVSSAPMKPEREMFFRGLDSTPFDALSAKYCGSGRMARLRRKLAGRFLA